MSVLFFNTQTHTHSHARAHKKTLVTLSITVFVVGNGITNAFRKGMSPSVLLTEVGK